MLQPMADMVSRLSRFNSVYDMAAIRLEKTRLGSIRLLLVLGVSGLLYLMLRTQQSGESLMDFPRFFINHTR